MAKLEADSILVSFGDRQLLTNIYLCCQTGEVVGLLGRNGSGKSTLLQVVFGSFRGQQQSVRINGKYLEVPFSEPGTIAYLPQHQLLPNALQVGKAIKLMCQDAGWRRQLMQHQLFAHRLHEPVHKLSGGERRLLEVLLVLHMPVEFVLLDEPFSHISPLVCEATAEAIMAALPHKGIILTDHNYNEVAQVATRTLLLHQGRLQTINSLEDLTDYGYLPD